MIYLWGLLVRFLWFYASMGLLVSVGFWTIKLAREKNRRKFDDAVIHAEFVRGETDPITLQLADIFGSRLGVVLLLFIAWPVTLYQIIFPPKKA